MQTQENLDFQSKLRYEQDLAELEQRRREFEAEKAEWEKRIENDKVSRNWVQFF